VITHGGSHVAEDETGAPEMFSGGAKLLTCDTPLGKVTPEAVEAHCGIIERIHTSRPRVVSLTQSTEMGTVYRVAEIEAVAAVARRYNLKVHMDGARFANAVASLNAKPADLTWRAGVDVMSLGGVKNGLGAGEAVVFFDKALSAEFAWRVKQGGQLNSKMRLVTAPWCALLRDDLWLRNARHANAMAQRLAAALNAAPGVSLLFPVEANAVFAEIAPQVQAAVRARGWSFYTFLGKTGCRLMCAWDTAPETVDAFAADVVAAAGTHA
jgi:threonine aldolase